MFPNLEAEQKKNWHTDACIAKKLNLSKRSYESKKKTGRFNLWEMRCLVTLYETSFEHLFAIADESTPPQIT